MSTDKNKVENFCGEYPENFESLDLSVIKNYVFENDPNYAAVTLFDADKNVVTVNSFLECEHYVIGGWDFVPNAGFNENVFHIGLAFISLIGIASLYIFFNRILRPIDEK